MSKNANMIRAKKAKNDEFYTRLSDIEKELKHYRGHFKGKTVYCNCDDATESKFFHYFSHNFDFLGLKKLITTTYSGLDEGKKATCCIYTGGFENSVPIMSELDIRELEGNGDFRSAECIEFLQEADIVVTNPPFSLFREFVAQLEDFDKKYLIIGNMNAITYKETFKLIYDSKMWVGVNFNKTMKFQLSANAEKYNEIVNEKKYGDVPAISWFTNLEHNKRHEDIHLYKKYEGNEDFYPKYDNYDAINVGKVKNIPYDYDGIMGVPISFLGRHNPKQFEILGLGISNSGIKIGVLPYKPEHKEYRKKIQKRGAVDGDLYMMEDGIVKVPYARILIKRIGETS